MAEASSLQADVRTFIPVSLQLMSSMRILTDGAWIAPRTRCLRIEPDERLLTQIESSPVTRAPSLFDVTAALQEPVEDDEWLINFSEIELGRVIGRGAFGEVVRGMWRHTDVAVKRFYDVSESLLEVSL